MKDLGDLIKTDSGKHGSTRKVRATIRRKPQYKTNAPVLVANSPTELARIVLGYEGIFDLPQYVVDSMCKWIQEEE